MKITVVSEMQRQADAENAGRAGKIDHGTIESVNGRASLDGEFHVEDLVRAILTAMRDPTEAMVEAGNGSEPFNFTGYFEGKVHAVVQRSWPAMNDAALAE